MNQRFEITTKSILFFFLVCAGLWVFWQIRDIVFLLLIAFILMSAFRPIIDFLEKLKIPRPIGIIFIYVFVFGFLGASLVGIIPFILGQVVGLLRDLPTVIERVIPSWNIDTTVITKQFSPITEDIFRITFDLFSNIFTLITVLVFTFYFLLERQHLKRMLTSTFGEENAVTIFDIIQEIEKKMGSWLHAEMILMLVIGVMTYIGLSWLRVEFALPLAIIAGTLEVIPNIGPIISAVPAILIALTVSPFFACVVAGLYFLIQQTENTIIVPLVMRKSTGLPPLVTIVSFMIGARLAGLMGAILAVPVVLMIQIIISTLLKREKEKKQISV